MIQQGLGNQPYGMNRNLGNLQGGGASDFALGNSQYGLTLTGTNDLLGLGGNQYSNNGLVLGGQTITNGQLGQGIQ